MIIGLGKEIKTDERRVALQPFQARELSKSGHQVFVETGAGKTAGFSDEDFEHAGAKITDRKTLYEKAKLILKVKCPLPEEIHLFRPGQILFAYLHFDENIPAEKIREIVGTGVTGIAYEWVQEGDKFPLLEPMSALSGILFALKSLELLAKHKGKIGGAYLKNLEPARCLIIGIGRIGVNALNVMLANRVRVDILDKNPMTISNRFPEYLDKNLWEKNQDFIETIRFDTKNPQRTVAEISRRMSSYDIILNCAVRREDLPKSKLEYLISRDMVRGMEANSVICDATACDRDLLETAVSREKLDEFYFDENVVHYNCDHIPAAVPQTATKLLTESAFPYVKKLAEGLVPALKSSAGLFKAVMCHNGKLTHGYSARKKGLDFVSLEEIL